MLAINIVPVPAFPVLAFILQFHKNPCDGQMLFSFVTQSRCSVTQGRTASFGGVWLRNPVGTASSRQGFPPRPVQLWLLTGNCGRAYSGWFWTICFLVNCSGSAWQTGCAGQWRAFRAWSFPALWLNHGLFGWEGTATPAWDRVSILRLLGTLSCQVLKTSKDGNCAASLNTPAVLQERPQGKCFSLYPVWTSSFSLWPLCLILLPSPPWKEPGFL